jgi:hypothetical protein
LAEVLQKSRLLCRTGQMRPVQFRQRSGRRNTLGARELNPDIGPDGICNRLQFRKITAITERGAIVGGISSTIARYRDIACITTAETGQGEFKSIYGVAQTAQTDHGPCLHDRKQTQSCDKGHLFSVQTNHYNTPIASIFVLNNLKTRKPQPL